MLCRLGSTPEKPNVCPQNFVSTPPPEKGPKMKKISRKSSVLTHFLGGGGGNEIHFMDKCFFGHLALPTEGEALRGLSAIAGTAPGVTPRIVGLAFLSQVVIRESLSEFRERFREYPEEDRELPRAPTKQCPFTQEVSNLIIRLRVAVFWSCTRKKTLDGGNSALVTGL